jgi:hypothetical protein
MRPQWTLSWARLIQSTPQTNFSNIHFNIFLPFTPRSSEPSLLFRLSSQNFVSTPHPSHACNIPCQSHLPLLDLTYRDPTQSKIQLTYPISVAWVVPCNPSKSEGLCRISLTFCLPTDGSCCKSAAAWFLGSRVRIPLGAWMFVSWVYMLCYPV